MTTINHSIKSDNSFYAFTFVRFFAGFYYYAQKDSDARM